MTLRKSRAPEIPGLGTEAGAETRSKLSIHAPRGLRAGRLMDNFDRFNSKHFWR
jgi:hypothetical protein